MSLASINKIKNKYLITEILSYGQTLICKIEDYFIASNHSYRRTIIQNLRLIRKLCAPLTSASVMSPYDIVALQVPAPKSIFVDLDFNITPEAMEDLRQIADLIQIFVRNCRLIHSQKAFEKSGCDPEAFYKTLATFKPRKLEITFEDTDSFDIAWLPTSISDLVV